MARNRNTSRERPTANRGRSDIKAVVKVGIRQAAELVDRRPGTLRKWEADGVLPKDLMPSRADQRRRYWTIEQIEGIRKWIAETKRIPGKSLPNYNPTEKSLNKALSHMRRPRVCAICSEAITSKHKYTRVKGRAVHRDCLKED